MRTLKDMLLWLSGGVRDGRQFFWTGCTLYGVFCWLLVASEYAPVDARTGAVLTLSVLALGEASVRFATWCSSVQDHPYAGDWARWGLWGRPAVAAHVALVWLSMAMFKGVPPLSVMLITLAAIAFGLAKTLPGLKVEGRVANTLLFAMIAIPCFAVAALGSVLGL
jgi:hypothetical protein